MKKTTKNIFLTEIFPWYKKHARKLPWRKSRISAYEVWVSEVMLQQTQVPRVVEYYARFLKKFPTVRHLARASWEEFLPYWDGLGYYARGRNMLMTAKIVAEKYNGKFPRDKKLLIELPGIGEYTACAILSFAYGKPEVAFDTNFKKIFGTRAKAEKAFRETCLLPQDRQGKVSSRIFNSAVMDYASKPTPSQPPPLKRGRGTQVPNFLPPSLEVRKRMPGASEVRKGWGVETILTLHENHKKYYSLSKKKYEPFVMPKGIVSREEIKKYFLEKYNLKLSVRPPHKKEVVNGTLTICVNAQILLGNPAFSVYNKAQIDKK